MIDHIRIIIQTGNLSKADVTRNSINAATWGIGVQRAIKRHCVLKAYPKIWGLRTGELA